MWAIVKKELKSYFYSPIGYISVGIFLFVFSVFFYLAVFGAGSADLGNLYYYTALYGLLIIVPILTMRMFAEERKNGTEQLLFTSPISIYKIVLGKLLAGLMVICITLLISFIYYIILLFFGVPNIKMTLVSMFGFLLISLAAMSFGMFASSLTENQIISGIITIAFMLMSLFIGNISDIFSGFVLMNFYENFAKGLISLENVIQYLAFSLVFILMTIIVLRRRKLVK